MGSETQRSRGVLTRSDREFLRGEKEYQSKEAAINKRRDIRQRIANGILDFPLISRGLLDKDRQKLFSQMAEGDDETKQYVDGIKALLSWIYVGLKEGKYDAKRIFESAVEIGEGEVGLAGTAKIVQTDVNLSVRTREIEGVIQTIEKLERGDPVEAHQLYPLVRNDVSVDFSEVTDVCIFADTSREDGERAIIETIFSDYFDADVEIELVFENID